MSALIQNWPAEAFDAISIWAPGTQFTITSTDQDQVTLEGDLGEYFQDGYTLEVIEQWLQFHLWDDRYNGVKFTLRLPSKKAFTLDLSAWSGQVEVSNLEARLQILLGKGSVRFQNCQGILSAGVGNGNITFERCVEKEMPVRPLMPQRVAYPDPPETFTMPSVGQGRPQPDNPWDWIYWAPEVWTEWGTQFGERARSWAMKFSKSFFPLSLMGWKPQASGLNAQAGKGDARLEDIQADQCTIQLGKGDIKLERGRVANLKLNTANGNLECRSVLPDGNWSLHNSHGDIDLSIPSSAQARLDAATRHGDIRSEIPLVRVARPGPEASHGGRMVGSLGATSEENVPVISLVTLHGDIHIDTRRVDNVYPSRRPAAPPQPSGAAQQPNPVSSQPSDASQPGSGTTPQYSSVNPPAVIIPPTPPAPAPTAFIQQQAPTSVQPEAAAPEPQPVIGTPIEDAQLAILEALSQGSITVQEAEQLLHNL